MKRTSESTLIFRMLGFCIIWVFITGIVLGFSMDVIIFLDISPENKDLKDLITLAILLLSTLLSTLITFFLSMLQK